MTDASANVKHITSRDNPWLKGMRRLSQDASAYRKQGQVWLEGDHLCRAALARGCEIEEAVFTESAWQQAPESWRTAAARQVVLADDLFAGISGLESPASMGFVLRLPSALAIAPLMPTVVLDRVQDAGNVGSILRSASAFGYKQVLALKGSAALWSPKVLRAGTRSFCALQACATSRWNAARLRFCLVRKRFCSNSRMMRSTDSGKRPLPFPPPDWPGTRSVTNPAPCRARRIRLTWT